MTVGSRVKQTLSGLKGIQGTLRTYESQSQKDDSKAAYSKAVSITEMVIKDLEARIRTLEFEEPQYKGK